MSGGCCGEAGAGPHGGRCGGLPGAPEPQKIERISLLRALPLPPHPHPASSSSLPLPCHYCSQTSASWQPFEPSQQNSPSICNSPPPAYQWEYLGTPQRIPSCGGPQGPSVPLVSPQGTALCRTISYGDNRDTVGPQLPSPWPD